MSKDTINTRKLLLVCLILILLVTAGFTGYFRFRKHAADLSKTRTQERLYSQEWVQYSMDITRKVKPSPVEAARFYAYVASVYFEVLDKTEDFIKASEASRQIINQIYPEEKEATNTFFKNLTNQDSTVLSNDQQLILNSYLEREKNDGMRTLVWDGRIPTGEGKWVKSNKEPYSPRAGEWKRWIVEGKTFEVSAPPVINSDLDKQELLIVTEAIAKRDEEWNKKIIFWQGIPGTETPSGIWQNLLYKELKDKKVSDITYAMDQKILAQSLADSFMECWKVKYVYWTARPSMRIPGIVTSMPDPPFPSYLSGHSTISRTAAEVLSRLVPEKKDYWMDEAEEAKQSRLYAGIHFDVDNREGAKLGEKIGLEIVNTLQL